MPRRFSLAAAALTCAVQLLPAAHPSHAQHGGMPTPTTPAPPVYPDLGSWTHPVKTVSEEAQIFFDQGLRLTYGFNHDEAIRAFREAARRDPQCAMAHWGIAYALGPNINLPMDDERHAQANAAIARARELMPHASERDRDYISALSKRYSNDPVARRGALDSAYADAMRDLARRHKDDADAATLYAEALLDLSPWNQWTVDGKPRPGTQEVVRTLEGVLKRWPDHPGANHYYIHTVEASPNPERGLTAASRLGTLVPGAGHLVHMPSHIYIRTGRYQEAVTTNQKAVAVDERYIREQKPEGIYPLMYYNHNIHFVWFGSCMEGRSALALEHGRKVAGNVSPELAAQLPMLEFVPPVPILTLVRFGRWDEVLAEPAPAASMRYTSGLWHYARGMAHAAKKDEAAARVALDSLRAIAEAMPPEQMVSTNYAKPLLEVAEQVLAGEVARRAGRFDESITRLRAAAELEAGLKFDEPPTWYYPVRQSLGAALLEAGRPGEAEAVYRADLKRFPDNGWSLKGLALALRAQDKAKDADATEARFKTAWARADVPIAGSVY